MKTPVFPQIERGVARCRIILSLIAIIAVSIDPTEPFLRAGPSSIGGFAVDPIVLVVMGSHLLYSLALYYAVTAAILPAKLLMSISIWGDVLMGALIAIVTEGVSSPFYPFFVFAVVQVGLRGSVRQTISVTAVSVALYLSLIVVSTSGWLNFYIMRPVYLAIIGYLVADLGRQHRNLEKSIQTFAAAEQRDQIARDLHDGWAQALAGTNLSLESCLELLREQRIDDARMQLAELQRSVKREYDELRSYMRSLVGQIESGPAGRPAATRFAIRTDVSGSAAFLDHVLQILREGVSNVSRHAHAASAHLVAQTKDGRLAITIDDDGVGFLDGTQHPWSITSRVHELDGRLEIIRDGRPGVHLAIQAPQG
jgi:signal transduction histidine kinase